MGTNLVYLILAIFISIPVSIIINLLTPSIQEWFTNRPKVSATKKLNSLITELDEVTQYHENQDYLSLKNVSTGFLVLLYLSIGNAAAILPAMLPLGFPIGSISFFASFFFFANAILVSLNHIRIISKIRNYDQFKQDIEEQMEKVREQGAILASTADLSIESARYGAKDKFIDVTEELQNKIIDGKLELTVSNEIKRDPIQGVPKVLKVVYIQNNVKRDISVEEGKILYLP